MTIDVAFENHSSLWLLRPVTPEAAAWVTENVGDDETQTWAGATVVEPRFVEALVEGLRADGFEVSLA